MNFEIQTRSDPLTGVSLHVKIPEDTLDQKALYTVLSDRPGYILPFRHRNVDGQVELVYQVGTKNKLRHLPGDRSAKEYAQLWTGILKPLLDCGDWFMRPYSFFLGAGHLYFEKNDNTVSYIYIPSKLDCSDYGDLKEMAAEVSKLISVSDVELENKILRGIVGNFNPKDFLQMLLVHMSASARHATSSAYQIHDGAHHTTSSAYQMHDGAHSTASNAYQIHDGARHATSSAYQMHDGARHTTSNAYQIHDGARHTTSSAYQMHDGANGPDSSDDIREGIVINVPPEKSAKKKTRGKSKKSECSGKEAKNSKEGALSVTNLFRKKKSVADIPYENEILTHAPPGSAVWELGRVSATNPGQQPCQAVPHNPLPATINDVTESISLEKTTARLRYIGREHMPLVIEVSIKDGEIFTIGRFDSTVGKQLNSFEFDKITKAVSRRHVVIERDSDEYKIIDLSSSAGTFLNEHRLPPNTPYTLEKNCRVSFGNSGADYVWEE